MESTTITLPADKALRAAWFTADSFAHPAKIHVGFLLWLAARYTSPGDTVCDPMAGIGSVLLLATIRRNVIARELEAGWTEACHQNARAIWDRAGLLALGTMDIAQAVRGSITAPCRRRNCATSVQGTGRPGCHRRGIR